MTLALAADYGLVGFQAYPPWSSTWSWFHLIPNITRFHPATVQLFCLMTLLPLASCCWRLTIYDLLLRLTMPPKRLWIGLISRWQWRQAIDPPILASAPILSAKVKGILRGRPSFRIWKVSLSASNLFIKQWLWLWWRKTYWENIEWRLHDSRVVEEESLCWCNINTIIDGGAPGVVAGPPSE